MDALGFVVIKEERLSFLITDDWKDYFEVAESLKNR